MVSTPALNRGALLRVPARARAIDRNIRLPRVRAASITFLMTGLCVSAAPETPAADDVPSANPLAVESELPYQFPPFDRVTDAHFVPMFERGMAEELREVVVIAANPEPATFENTIVALERSGQLLARVD